MCFKAFYTSLKLLVNSYDYILLMHTEMFMSHTFYLAINNIYLIYIYGSFIHLLGSSM